jgi:hypothetical protein
MHPAFSWTSVQRLKGDYQKYSPASLLSLYCSWFFLFLMTGACNQHGSHQDDNADDTELPKLISTQKPYNWKLCQWQESWWYSSALGWRGWVEGSTKAISYNISGVGHSTMPGVTSIKLPRGSNI